MNKLVGQYNHQNNVIIISPYPEKGHRYSKKSTALGGFSKNIVEQIGEYGTIILTFKLTKKTNFYEENKNLVIRFFKRNSIFSFFHLIYYLVRFNKVKKVLIQFEFASFGNTLISGLFALIPVINKILNKETYFVFHQVLTNTNQIEEYLGWRKNDLKNLLFTPALRFFYFFISVFSKKIVVLEEEFKKRLIDIKIKNNKIAVIPHGVDTQLKSINKKIARKKLNLPLNKKIFLFFGYLTWYKGADIFLKMAKNDQNKNHYYVIAGGPSLTQENKPHYKNYLKQFNNLPKNCLLTNFVPENKIKLYYSASDLIIFPYRIMFSSSGPLSLAFSFEKPIFLSDKLINYIKSKDFSQNMKLADLRNNELFFSITNKNYINKLSKLKIHKLIKFSHLMKKRRSYSLITNYYLSLITNHNDNKIRDNNYNLAFSIK